MKTIKESDFKAALQVLLTETFEGAPPEVGSVYLDKRVGMFLTLDELTAETASMSGGGPSIASHTEHVRFYLSILTKYLRSTADFVDWRTSWRVARVDADEWKALRVSLREEYDGVRDTVRENEKWDINTMTVVFAFIAHSAYHLGAIRQLVKKYDEH